MLHNGVGEGAVDAESKLSSLFEFLSGMKRMGSVFVQPCDANAVQLLLLLIRKAQLAARGARRPCAMSFLAEWEQASLS